MSSEWPEQLPVNPFCYVLRGNPGWGNQTRGYQR